MVSPSWCWETPIYPFIIPPPPHFKICVLVTTEAGFRLQRGDSKCWAQGQRGQKNTLQGLPGLRDSQVTLAGSAKGWFRGSNAHAVMCLGSTRGARSKPRCWEAAGGTAGCARAPLVTSWSGGFWGQIFTFHCLQEKSENRRVLVLACGSWGSSSNNKQQFIYLWRYFLSWNALIFG